MIPNFHIPKPRFANFSEVGKSIHQPLIARFGNFQKSYQIHIPKPRFANFSEVGKSIHHPLTARFGNFQKSCQINIPKPRFVNFSEVGKSVHQPPTARFGNFQKVTKSLPNNKSIPSFIIQLPLADVYANGCFSSIIKTLISHTDIML